MVTGVLQVMRETFTNVQTSKSTHQRYLSNLKAYYEKSDHEEFTDAFIKCLQVPLSVGEKAVPVENTLNFAARFASNLHSPDANESADDEMCPFLLRLLNFLLAQRDAVDIAVRFRCCYFLNMLLNSLGENAFLEDHICDKIMSCMMECVLDTSAKVRAQAILVLHRLQDPEDENCPVIKVYIYHLIDPSSEVRKAVITSIAKSQRALLAIIKRIRDIDNTVRKEVYRYISKVTFRSLNMEQRETVLQQGLTDRSEGVRTIVKNVLLPSWLVSFNDSYLRFLKALDVETATDIALMTMKALISRETLEKNLEQLPIDPETKLIPLEKLTRESVVYWRSIVEYLHEHKRQEDVERCVPELTKFSQYLQAFLDLLETAKDSETDMFTLQFILLQLFKIAETYDLSDEMGRTKLSEFMLDTLMSDHCSAHLAKVLVQYFERVVPDVNNRITSLVHVISEIRITMRQYVPTQINEADQNKRKIEKATLKVKLNEIQEEEYEAIQRRDFLRAQNLKEQIEIITKELDEMEIVVPPVMETVSEEKNDPVTMIKCLTIMCNIVAASSVTTFPSTLRSLYENLALPSISHENHKVFLLALEAVGTCCLLDGELAKKHILLYVMQFTVEEKVDVYTVSLKVIFDLLLHYGFGFFGIVEDESDDTQMTDRSRRSGRVRLYSHSEIDLTDTSSHSNSHRTTLVNILIGLIDHEDQGLRTLATEGMCKLLLHSRVSGGKLLSRLIILLFNPANEEDLYMRQCLGSFFKQFVSGVADSREMLEGAFMPTLKTLANAPDTSPLQAIDPCDVAAMILGLTSACRCPPGREDYTIHNNLAMAILVEALDESTVIDTESLLKSLKYLDIYFEDDTTKDNILEAADKIEASLNESDAGLVKYIREFKNKIMISRRPTAEDIDPIVSDNVLTNGVESTPRQR